MRGTIGKFVPTLRLSVSFVDYKVDSQSTVVFSAFGIAAIVNIITPGGVGQNELTSYPAATT